jgi:hypothetical protein
MLDIAKPNMIATAMGSHMGPKYRGIIPPMVVAVWSVELVGVVSGQLAQLLGSVPNRYPGFRFYLQVGHLYLISTETIDAPVLDVLVMALTSGISWISFSNLSEINISTRSGLAPGK